jgi:hypothetical protein
MTATPMSSPPFKAPVIDPSGRLSRSWQGFIQALYQRSGGSSDKIDAAHGAALAAASGSSRVFGIGGLHAGGALTGDVALSLYRAVAPVAALPTAGNSEGDWAYAVDGRKASEGAGAGTGVPVWWSGGRWFAVDSGAAVAS